MKRKIKNWLAVFLALIMGLGTLTAQNTVPLTEDFSGELPDGWTTTGGVTLSSGDGRIQITYGNSGYLITQKVMPTTNNHTLSFDLWACQWCDDKESNSFDLMVSTTNTEVSSFTSVLHIDGDDIQCSQTTQTVDLSAYIGQEIYLAFYFADGGYGASIALDNISGVDVVVPACAKPTGLTVSNITSSAAQVSWAGTAESYQLKYKTAAAEDWTTVTTSTNPYTIEGLEANTNYMVELSTVCGSEFSDAATTSFKTLCSSIAITSENAWEENFDSENSLSSCMALSDSYFTFATSDASNGRSANSGTNYIYAKWSANSYVYTPYFELTAGTPYKFTFMYITDGSSGWTTLEAGLFTEQNSSALVSAVGTPVSGPTNTTYTQYKGVFTPTESGTYCIGIHVQATGSPWYMSIDDLSLGLAPSCVEPTELAVSDITSSSATVSWAGTAESYQLKYKTTAEEDWTTVTTSANPYTIESLTANTSYMVELRSVCGSDLSDAAATSFSTPAPSVTEFPYNENFEGENQYVAVSGTGTNQWFIGSATGNDGNSLY
ncbi:MAG: fibronectin type III domain-containing protein, partial [Bacteroidales bacterium]|nr:fibronectin type III domain-containing protein [Bacteroidales bacterium]